jgi:hypothetical protein
MVKTRKQKAAHAVSIKSKQIKKTLNLCPTKTKKKLKRCLSTNDVHSNLDNEEAYIQPRLEEKPILIIRQEDIYFLRETYENPKTQENLLQEIRTCYGDGLLDLKVYYTTSYNVMIGTISFNDM